VKSLATGELLLIDRLRDGTPSFIERFTDVAIAGDGMTIIFASSDTRLANENGILPSASTKYLYRWLAATNEIVAVTSAQPFATADFGALSISADGTRFARGATAASEVDPPDNDSNGRDIYVHDFNTGETVVIGDAFSAPSYDMHLSPDGNSMVFASMARLVDDDDNFVTDLYIVSDIFGTPQYRRLVASTKTDPVQFDNPLKNLCNVAENFQFPRCDIRPRLSADGTKVLFATRMQLAGESDRNAVRDLYVVDTRTLEISLVSRRHDGLTPVFSHYRGAFFGEFIGDGTRAVYRASNGDWFGFPYPLSVSAIPGGFAFDTLAMCSVP
jgi:hypothetical protein